MEHYNCLVLAAGKSTRIASIANGKPKPLIEIAGKSILSRNLCWLASFGIKEVTINLHFKSEMIQTSIGNGEKFSINLNYIIEPDILGTAGALRNAEKHWNNNNPVLIIYGDNLFNFDLEAFFKFHKSRHSEISIALFDQNKNPHTGIAGGRVVINKDNTVQRFEENASNTNSNLINAGAYLIAPEIVEQIPEHTFYDFGKDFFPKLLEKNTKIQAHIINGYCLGLDTPESFRNGVALIRNKEVELL